MPQRVKDRAEVLRLNAQGWYVEKIAEYLNWHRQTVRDTLHINVAKFVHQHGNLHTLTVIQNMI